MVVAEIINNKNFETEFPFVIRIVNEYGEITKEFYSHIDEIPQKIKQSEVIYLNVVNGYAEFYNMAVMIIEVFEN